MSGRFDVAVSGARVAEARQARGWTQSQLGEAAGLDTDSPGGTIRRVEETGWGLTPSEVGVVADVLGVGRAWLLGSAAARQLTGIVCRRAPGEECT